MAADLGALTPQLLIKKIGLLNTLAGWGLENSPSLMEIHQMHVAILKAGNTLKNSIAALESLGDVDARIDKDKNKVRMSAVLAAHTSLAKHIAKLEEKRQSLSDDPAMLPSPGAEAGDIGYAADLESVQSSMPFMNMMEHEAIYDTLSRHLVCHGEALWQATQKAKALCAKVSDWKNNFTAETEIQEVLAKGATTLLKMELRGLI